MEEFNQVADALQYLGLQGTHTARTYPTHNAPVYSYYKGVLPIGRPDDGTEFYACKLCPRVPFVTTCKVTDKGNLYKLTSHLKKKHNLVVDNPRKRRKPDPSKVKENKSKTVVSNPVNIGTAPPQIFYHGAIRHIDGYSQWPQHATEHGYPSWRVPAVRNLIQAPDMGDQSSSYQVTYPTIDQSQFPMAPSGQMLVPFHNLQRIRVQTIDSTSQNTPHRHVAQNLMPTLANNLGYSSQAHERAVNNSQTTMALATPSVTYSVPNTISNTMSNYIRNSVPSTIPNDIPNTKPNTIFPSLANTKPRTIAKKARKKMKTFPKTIPYASLSTESHPISTDTHKASTNVPGKNFKRTSEEIRKTTTNNHPKKDIADLANGQTQAPGKMATEEISPPTEILHSNENVLVSASVPVVTSLLEVSHGDKEESKSEVIEEQQKEDEKIPEISIEMIYRNQEPQQEEHVDTSGDTISTEPNQVVLTKKVPDKVEVDTKEQSENVNSTITNAILAVFLAKCETSFSLLDDPIFRDTIAFLNPEAASILQDKQQLLNSCYKISKQLKQFFTIFLNCNNVRNISIVTSGWSFLKKESISLVRTSFLCIEPNSNEFKKINLLLGGFESSNEKPKLAAQKINQVLEEYNISNKVDYCCTELSENMTSTVEDLKTEATLQTEHLVDFSNIVNILISIITKEAKNHPGDALPFDTERIIYNISESSNLPEAFEVILDKCPSLTRHVKKIERFVNALNKKPRNKQEWLSHCKSLRLNNEELAQACRGTLRSKILFASLNLQRAILRMTKTEFDLLDFSFIKLVMKLLLSLVQFSRIISSGSPNSWLILGSLHVIKKEFGSFAELSEKIDVECSELMKVCVTKLEECEMKYCGIDGEVPKLFVSASYLHPSFKSFLNTEQTNQVEAYLTKELEKSATNDSKKKCLKLYSQYLKQSPPLEANREIMMYQTENYRNVLMNLPADKKHAPFPGFTSYIKTYENGLDGGTLEDYEKLNSNISILLGYAGDADVMTPLNAWHQRRSDYPVLSEIALKIFSMPVTTYYGNSSIRKENTWTEPFSDTKRLTPVELLRRNLPAINIQKYIETVDPLRQLEDDQEDGKHGRFSNIDYATMRSFFR